MPMDWSPNLNDTSTRRNSSAESTGAFCRQRGGTTNYWVLPAILIIVIMGGIFLGGSLLHIFISNFW